MRLSLLPIAETTSNAGASQRRAAQVASVRARSAFTPRVFRNVVFPDMFDPVTRSDESSATELGTGASRIGWKASSAASPSRVVTILGRHQNGRDSRNAAVERAPSVSPTASKSARMASRRFERVSRLKRSAFTSRRKTRFTYS